MHEGLPALIRRQAFMFQQHRTFGMHPPLPSIVPDSLAYFSRKAHHTTRMSTNSAIAAARNQRPDRAKAALASHVGRAPHRTTITLSPESQEIVERFKSATGASTSAAIDRIIQDSQPRPSRLKEVNRRLVLDLPGKPGLHFTLEHLKQAEDDADREYVERILPRGWKSPS
jgi:hypothetical protein